MIPQGNNKLTRLESDVLTAISKHVPLSPSEIESGYLALGRMYDPLILTIGSFLALSAFGETSLVSFGDFCKLVGSGLLSNPEPDTKALANAIAEILGPL